MRVARTTTSPRQAYDQQPGGGVIATAKDRVYDVAIVSDLRYSGGTTASIAEEVRAQARAGMSTVLVQVPSPHLRAPRSFSPRVLDCLRDGSAELALPGERVRSRLMVMRQPRVFAADPDPVPRVEAERSLMVINQGPRDLNGSREYYELGDVRLRVQRCFGEDVQWAPIGPLVREQVLSYDPSFALTDYNWHNIIDVDDWLVDRSQPVSTVPVIGRHSRPDAKKWPRTSNDILRAYPASREFRVRILGGADPALDRLGSLPDNWEVLPFGAKSACEFLAEIDYYVYFHDRDWVEAFGRAVLEALASGLPVIIPEHFRPLFGDAPIYATPEQVPGLVRRLHSDWQRYQEVSSTAVRLTRQRFGYPSHLARLAELGVATSAGGDAVPASAGGDAVPGADRKPSPYPAFLRRRRDDCILMLSSNGAGLGHVTRLMAIARRLPDDVRTVIATQSQAAPLVRDEGYLTEYIPSSRYLAIPSERWNELLYERLRHLVDLYRPGVVAVDGTVPYGGLLRTIREHRDIRWVWVRRAMWKAGLGGKWIERGLAYDHIVEPGELAESADQGLTVPQRDQAHRVGPITYLDAPELLTREHAREALNLDERPAALVQLGAGNINDTTSTTARASTLLGDLGFQVVLARSPIATAPPKAPPGASTVTIYPVSRYLNAFDLSISAPGYNSFHEALTFAVPTLFVPNENTELDDQRARACYVAQEGAAMVYEQADGEGLEEALTTLAKPEKRAELAQRCRELARPNGAVEAAAWLASLLPGRKLAGG